MCMLDMWLKCCHMYVEQIVVYKYFFYICICMFFFFFKQKTAYEMRISDWSSDVCSSDLHHELLPGHMVQLPIEAQTPPHPVRALYSGGYVEGWAIFAEALAIERGLFDGAPAGEQIGRASCRERVCQYA